MKKDLRSYLEHNSQYETYQTLDRLKKTIIEYEKEDMYKRAGFQKAISEIKDIKIHIDIGSGGGWLILKTSDFFKKVIGIEPSKMVCENVKIIINEKRKQNIDIINMDMVDGLRRISPKEPVFLTTAIVLSHIRDFHVINLLDEMSKLPDGSAFYFCERYDTNIQQKMWYIRNKNWWAKHLSDWQLVFFDIEDSGYLSGIFGIKIGAEKVTNHYELRLTEKIAWELEGLKNKIKRVLRYTKRQMSSLILRSKSK